MGRRLLWVVALVAVVLPACGGGGKSSSPPCPPKADTRAAVGGKVAVCAYDINFNGLKTITTPAGPLEITLINKGNIAHTLQVEKTPLELKTNGHNDVATGTVTLTTGTYAFRCTVSGHEAAGMKGTIVVS